MERYEIDAAGDPGRMLVDGRGVRDLHRYHFTEGRLVVGPP